MRIGIICEGGRNGADQKVYEFLVRQLLPDATIKCSPLGNKPTLIALCGTEAKALLEIEGCDRIIIIWDLQPPWKEKKGKACRKNDCELIRASLNDAALDARQLQSIHLVCMQQELETLFICDEQAISLYLYQKSKRPCKVKYFKHPEHPLNPKDELDKIFRVHSGPMHRYIDMKDAEGIIRLVDIRKLQRCTSFMRLAIKIADKVTVARIMGISFKQYSSEEGQ